MSIKAAESIKKYWNQFSNHYKPPHSNKEKLATNLKKLNTYLKIYFKSMLWFNYAQASVECFFFIVECCLYDVVNGLNQKNKFLAHSFRLEPCTHKNRFCLQLPGGGRLLD